MSKYHVGPSGAGPCKATAGRCPFGGDDVHFTTQEAAQQAFEKSMGGPIAKATKRPAASPDDYSDEPVSAQVLTARGVPTHLQRPTIGETLDAIAKEIDAARGLSAQTIADDLLTRAVPDLTLNSHEDDLDLYGGFVHVSTDNYYSELTPYEDADHDGYHWSYLYEVPLDQKAREEKELYDFASDRRRFSEILHDPALPDWAALAKHIAQPALARKDRQAAEDYEKAVKAFKRAEEVLARDAGAQKRQSGLEEKLAKAQALKQEVEDAIANSSSAIVKDTLQGAVAKLDGEIKTKEASLATIAKKQAGLTAREQARDDAKKALEAAEKKEHKRLAPILEETLAQVYPHRDARVRTRKAQEWLAAHPEAVNHESYNRLFKNIW